MKRIKYILSESKKYIKIVSIETLKQLSEDLKSEQLDVFIMLNFGAQSSKDIFYNDGAWSINHCIDDTQNDYENDKEFLKNEEFFFNAISSGAVWTHNTENLK